MKKILQQILTVVILVSVSLTMTACKKDKKTTPKGTVVINSVPTGADIYYNGKKIGVTPKEISGIPKSYIFKLQKDGWQDYFVVADIKESQQTNVMADMTQVRASCLVTSIPLGVNVKMNNKIIGTTPMVIRDLTFGSHEIVLQKSGYSEKYVKFEVTDSKPKKITENLNSNLGTLALVTEPAGVSVYHGDKFLGETPFKLELSEGKYNFLFKKTDYYDLDAEIIVESGKTKTSKHLLTVLPAAIHIDSSIEGADIYLNGKLAGKTPALIEKLVANKDYELIIKAKNHISNTQTLKLVPGKTQEIFVDLNRNVGDVELVVNPPGATIYIDGQKYGVVQKGAKGSMSEVFRVKDLSAGTHVLKITHKRAKPDHIIKKFEVKPDEVTRIDGIKLWIPDTELLLKDGSREIGLIVSENKRNGYIFFESKPGLKYSVKYSDIEKIIPLSAEE